MAKVHSFDVFDTSLIRKVAAPTDVFRLIGRLIASKGDMRNQSDFVEDFLSARIQAEREAKLHCEETTLDQIWAHLREMMPQIPLPFGPQDELDVERKLLLPNAAILQRVNELRSIGARIIFTSDTYLPEQFVHERLRHYGLFKDGDRIYASSTAGVTKWSGGLFKAILNSEGVAARDLHHCGDDPHSDVVTPRSLGISATLWTGSRLNIWERAILSKNIDGRMAESLLVGSMRAFRLSSGFQSKSGADQLVATFLGPALMVWATWVLSSAQRDGVRRLYFVSRDAYLLCIAARVLAPHFGDIDCRYLKISRQSVSLPSTDEISPSGMPWLYRRWEPAQLGYLVLKLGLRWTDIAPHFSSLAKGQGELKRLATDTDWNEFWDILQKTPVADCLQKQIESKRARALAYLRAEGLCDDISMGIVDLGWYAMTQWRLRKLLGYETNTAVIRGYYLALLLDRIVPADSGKVTSLFYDQAPDHHGISPRYEAFKKRIDVLEHVLGLAPHGSVREYKACGSIAEPVCLAESPMHLEFVHAVEKAVEAFCRSNKGDASFYSDNVLARQIMDTLLSSWCVYPNRVALKALDNILVSEGPDNTLSEPLLQPWRLWDAAKTFVPGRWRNSLRICLPTPTWPEGSFYRSSLSAQLVLRLSEFLRRLSRRSRVSYTPPFKRPLS